ncbi:hypothetical protein VT84_12745 [Gemmata sp. SH-PL17]|nr:hypothetical protein VT84_12745 [Gemmata sp. SH-PL17]
MPTAITSPRDLGGAVLQLVTDVPTRHRSRYLREPRIDGADCGGILRGRAITFYGR